ncbi:septum formation family protein [Pseudactinotalea sp.]|uniref:septum formation family protein n=1 Tax=Pseudactinotalea sp. TaxID=1926260 RepID=UPI003B3B9A81
MRVRFNPPPGWPVPPGWLPPPGWDPDPTWPAAPDGWQFWVEVPPEPDRGGRRSGVRAAGAVIGVGLLVVGLILGISRLAGGGSGPGPTADPSSESDSPTEPETYTVTNSGTGLVSAEVGACTTTDVMDNSSVSTLPLMDCSYEHDAQVIGLFDVEGDEYPGVATVRADARAGCEEAFEDFVGIAVADSDLELWHISPTEGTWDNNDDREVICIAYLEEGSVTESWEGSQR